MHNFTYTTYRGGTGGETTKKNIEDSGESINAVQEESGVKAGALYRLLSEKHKDVTLTTAFKLTDALGVDINKFREEKYHAINN